VSFSEFSTVIGWLAVVLGTVGAYAQYRRINRAGVDGVSLATWVLFVLLAGFWIVYGVTVRSWELVTGSLFVLPLQLLILYRLRPWDRWRVGVRSLVFVSLCCAGPALWWGWSGAVIGVGSAGSFTRLPQLIRLVRVGEAAGVSVGSWSMAVLVSALWIVYYAGAHLWAVLVVTTLAGSVSLVVAGLSWWRHAQFSST
jgi:uncharacterized protein with PQ loop repeat